MSHIAPVSPTFIKIPFFLSQKNLFSPTFQPSLIFENALLTRRIWLLMTLLVTLNSPDAHWPPGPSIQSRPQHWWSRPLGFRSTSTGYYHLPVAKLCLLETSTDEYSAGPFIRPPSHKTNLVIRPPYRLHHFPALTSPRLNLKHLCR